MLEEIKDLKKLNELRIEFTKKLSNRIDEKDNKLKEKQHELTEKEHELTEKQLELAGKEKIIKQLGEKNKN